MDNTHVYALVTGASRGIGRSVAESLLKSGARVIGTARSSSFPEAMAAHERFEGVKVDLADRSRMEEVLHPLFRREDGPRVLVNNAAVNEACDFTEEDARWVENWRRTMAVNLEAPALLSKWALSRWSGEGGSPAYDAPGDGSSPDAASSGNGGPGEAGSGRGTTPVRGLLINIASRAAYRGDTREYASYAASKGGLVAFTKSVARDFGRFGISAYSIAPGFIDTDMAEEAVEVYGEEYLTSGMSFDRITSPGEVGELVAFLASGSVPHMTGATFHINGGSYMI